MQPRIDKLLAESLWVRRIAYSLLRDAHEAEDVTQEVLVTAYQQQPTASGASLRAWLRTVTKRKAARKQKLGRSRAYAEEQAARSESEQSSVADRVVLHSALAKAIGELPPLLGEAVMMRYFDDLAPRQIAKRLNVTSEVARQRVSRGLQHLRQRLDHDADPKSPERGRELWSAALLETLAPPKLVAVTALSPLLLMSINSKALFGFAACVLAAFLVWQMRDREATSLVERESAPASEMMTIVEPDGTTIAAEPGSQETRASIAPEVLATSERVLRIRTPEAQPPPHGKAAWVDENGAIHPVEVDEAGDADLTGVPRDERVWVHADAHVPGFIDLAPERDVFDFILDPGLIVPGVLIEDGGIPRARTTLKVRWNGLWAAELEADHVSEDMHRDLGLGYQSMELLPDAQGEFVVPGIPTGTELRFSLSSSHRFAVELPDDSWWYPHIAQEGETVHLRTIRSLSISARLLRSDNGKPVPYCNSYFHFRKKNGDRRGSFHEQADSRGYYSEGFTPPGWQTLSEEERDNAKESWVFVEWQFSPWDPSLKSIKGTRRLEGNEFFIDLGDLYLQSAPVLEAVVLGPGDKPVPYAAVRCSTGDLLRSNSKGRLLLPAEIVTGDVTVLALDYALRQFDSEDLIPAENGVIPLRLDPGIDVYLSLAEDNLQTLKELGVPIDDLRLSISWEQTPFLRSKRCRYPFDFQLHGELMDTNEGLGGFDQSHGPNNGGTFFPESGVVRLLSLQPDMPIQVQVRSVNASILSSIDYRTPKTPGRHEIKIPLPRTIPTAKRDDFHLSGQVVDEHSVPLSGVSVTFDLEDVRGYLDTDEQGRFESGPLPEDEWPVEYPFRIRLDREGHVELRREWASFAPEPLNGLLFVMPRSRSIEISAIGSEGAPVPIENVTLEGHPDVELEGQPTDEGTWISERAPRLDLRLNVQVDGETYPLDLGANDSKGLLNLPAAAR